MEKYKLIQLYPGSPEPEGTVYEKIRGLGLYKHPTKDNRTVTAGIIENNPKFWELVKEDLYMILSVKHISSGQLWNADSQIKYTYCLSNGRAPFLSLNEIKRYPGVYKIQAIKRFSDNEIFTLGCPVSYSNFKEPFIVLEEIILKRDTVFFRYKDNHVLYSDWLSPDCKVSDGAIFTTDDGKKVCTGDNYCTINLRTFEITEYPIARPGSGELSREFFKYYLTPEDAYRDQRVLSMNDILPHPSIDELYEKVKENLSKMKSNQWKR